VFEKNVHSNTYKILQGSRFISKTRELDIFLLRFEIPVAVNIKVMALWDLMMCSLAASNQLFGGICYVHLQNRNMYTIMSVYLIFILRFYKCKKES
jgi:hypothetical protein